MSDPIANMRRDYESQGLSRSELSDDPIAQFLHWFEDAQKEVGDHANVMTLATASAEGLPSARIILLKGVDHGFKFYTNYVSDKGEELSENPHGALVFWWEQLARQVRVKGVVEKLTNEESDAYFKSRPLGSQLSAIASPQSKIVSGREELEKRVEELQNELDVNEARRPSDWGGYRLIPSVIEFWQGRTNRLHDRFQYVMGDDGWSIERLGP